MNRYEKWARVWIRQDIGYKPHAFITFHRYKLEIGAKAQKSRIRVKISIHYFEATDGYS